MGAEEFDYASDRVWDLPQPPEQQELLDLYKLYFLLLIPLTTSYKQVTAGDCNVGRPGGWDLKGQKKWDSWNSVRGEKASRQS